VYRPRPLTIDIVAVLNLVIGTLGILGTCYGGGSILLLILLANSGILPPMGGGQFNPLQAQADLYQNKIPGFLLFATVSLLVGSFMSILLIIGSVDLFKLNPRGRKLCIIWSVYNIISGIVGTVYSIVLVIPATTEYLRESYDQMAKAGMPTPEPPGWTQYIGLLMGLVISGYAIALPILLYRRSASDALAGKWVPPWHEAQTDDEEKDSGESAGASPQGLPHAESQGIRPAQE
jgi:hypothetical protein